MVRCGHGGHFTRSVSGVKVEDASAVAGRLEVRLPPDKAEEADPD